MKKLTTEKLYIWCGPAALAVVFPGLLISRLLPLPRPEWSGDQVAAFYNSHLNSSRLGLVIAMWGCTLLGPWAAAIARAIKRIEGPDSISAGFQLVFGAFIVLEILVSFLFMQVAVFRPDRSPAVMQSWNDAGWLALIGFIFTETLEWLLTAYVILRDESPNPILPRWLAYIDIAAAVFTLTSTAIVFFPSGGTFAFNGLLGFWIPAFWFVAWVLATTVALLQAQKREPSVSLAEVPTVDQLAVEVAALRAELHRQTV